MSSSWLCLLLIWYSNLQGRANAKNGRQNLQEPTESVDRYYVENIFL